MVLPAMTSTNVFTNHTHVTITLPVKTQLGLMIALAMPVSTETASLV